MTPRAHSSRHALESCMLQLHSWNPFTTTTTTAAHSSPSSTSAPNKKPCLADRSTALPDFSRLSLFEDPPSSSARLRWINCAARKRRRKGSRSVSGRSSDRSATRRPAGGSVGELFTDSSGELFTDRCWGSDASEVKKYAGNMSNNNVNLLERESSGPGGSGSIVIETVPAGGQLQGVESGYGSEPGYRGDGELGYDDEVDEDEDDGRVLFWGDRECLGDHMDVIAENDFSEQKTHHRGRRKKHDWRAIAPLR